MGQQRTRERSATRNVDTRRPRRLRITWITLALAAVALGAIVVTQMSSTGRQSVSPSPSQNSAASLPAGPALTVNSDPVDAAEFLLQMGTNEAGVFQYFYDHYGVKDSASFWTTPHGGVTPLAMLRQLSDQQLVNLTVQLEMARARGLVKNITYAALIAGMQQENQRRATALAQHQPVYGPTSFTESTYFSYVTSNLETDLTQILEESMQPPGTAALERLYDQLRSQDFACPSSGQAQPGELQAMVQYCARGGKYMPFDSVKTQVLQQWKENQVEALIAAQVRVAKVRINAEVIDKVAAP